MGTIVIEQLYRAGSSAQPDTDIAKLDRALVRTGDSTTSTSAENVVLATSTSIVSIYAVEAHRISIGANTTGDGANYITINAEERRDFGVDPGQTLYYRLDA